MSQQGAQILGPGIPCAREPGIPSLLARQFSLDDHPRPSMGATDRSNSHDHTTNGTPTQEHSLTDRRLRRYSKGDQDGLSHDTRRSMSRRRLSIITREDATDGRKTNGDSSATKRGLGPLPVGGVKKFGMFSGVYVPTCLNVLSILMFLRFGFILGSSYQKACLKSTTLSLN